MEHCASVLGYELDGMVKELDRERFYERASRGGSLPSTSPERIPTSSFL